MMTGFFAVGMRIEDVRVCDSHVLQPYAESSLVGFMRLRDSASTDHSCNAENGNEPMRYRTYSMSKYPLHVAQLVERFFSWRLARCRYLAIGCAAV